MSKDSFQNTDHNETIINKEYWNKRWETKETGWDIGYASPALTKYIDGIHNKNIALLIPGCGNAYEAEYLLQHGFTNITLIDISPLAVEQLKQKFIGQSSITILCEDFFEHKENYDLILEQTFFSAISPSKRSDYALQMNQLLNKDGAIVGVLFDKQFHQSFPPYGGTREEYVQLFENIFRIKKIEACYNSIEPRKGSEVFIHLIKK